MKTKQITTECEACGKQRHNSPIGWYPVTENVNVWLCPECLEKAVSAYLNRRLHEAMTVQ